MQTEFTSLFWSGVFHRFHIFLLFSWVKSKTKQINWYLFLKERYKKIDLRNPHFMLFIALFKKCPSLVWVSGHCISQWQSSRMTCHCIHNQFASNSTVFRYVSIQNQLSNYRKSFL